MPGKKLAQVFPYAAVFQVAAQQALDRIRNLAGWTTVANRTRCRLIQANRAAQAEVVGVHHSPIELDLLALNPDVSNPVLSATVWTSGDVQFEILIETWQPFLQFLDQPTREALGLCDGQLANLCTAARN